MSLAHTHRYEIIGNSRIQYTYFGGRSENRPRLVLRSSASRSIIAPTAGSVDPIDPCLHDNHDLLSRTKPGLGRRLATFRRTEADIGPIGK